MDAPPPTPPKYKGKDGQEVGWRLLDVVEGPTRVTISMKAVDAQTRKRYAVDISQHYPALWVGEAPNAEGDTPIVVFSDGTLEYKEVKP